MLIVQELNQLQDKLAAAQLDLDSRDREIDELNRELDGKLHDHEKEIQLVNEEWIAETAEIKAQVEELRDVSPF
jgi:chromosome segregation ATPase